MKNLMVESMNNGELIRVISAIIITQVLAYLVIKLNDKISSKDMA